MTDKGQRLKDMIDEDSAEYAETKEFAERVASYTEKDAYAERAIYAERAASYMSSISDSGKNFSPIEAERFASFYSDLRDGIQDAYLYHNDFETWRKYRKRDPELVENYIQYIKEKKAEMNSYEKSTDEDFSPKASSFYSSHSTYLYRDQEEENSEEPIIHTRRTKKNSIQGRKLYDHYRIYSGSKEKK